MDKKFIEQQAINSTFLSDKPSQRACYVIPSFQDFDIKEYRKSLNMSQADFAKEHNISLGTLKKWERSSSQPIFGDALKRILNSWITHQSVAIK